MAPSSEFLPGIYLYFIQALYSKDLSPPRISIERYEQAREKKREEEENKGGEVGNKNKGCRSLGVCKFAPKCAVYVTDCATFFCKCNNASFCFVKVFLSEFFYLKNLFPKS